MANTWWSGSNLGGGVWKTGSVVSTSQQQLPPIEGVLEGLSEIIGDFPVTYKFLISTPNIVVDIYGITINHTFEYWLLTDSVIDSTIYNGNALNIVDKGTGLNIINGEGSITVTNASYGNSYNLIAFDADGSNYFRATSTIIQDSA